MRRLNDRSMSRVGIKVRKDRKVVSPALGCRDEYESGTAGTAVAGKKPKTFAKMQKSLFSVHMKKVLQHVSFVGQTVGPHQHHYNQHQQHKNPTQSTRSSQDSPETEKCMKKLFVMGVF